MTPSSETAQVMSASDIERALTRIAHEIVETHRGTAGLVILGIPRRGVPLARRLGEKLAGIDTDFDSHDQVGSLDITMYRDDLRTTGARTPEPTELPASGIDAATVVLVDDVLYSGRTIRAALDALSDLGRPETVRLAVLVDRGHRQLPIRADHVGKNIPTSRQERVSVRLAAIDGVSASDEAVVIQR
ncbi:bifunctional pyr operon transcriptional regulator/uracil phosphoribosyltransferase PyrR [Nesterenkonia alba]|uniref:bifunctional pyr operon transcriptional regulator/uracil phosphoribosyltransferase PyrR n=1 Tax=Nesterenkonia alba TaxID=515814 RepID=UPI0003B4105F|nr:bifunctional pyr operon transcriptional regulator/uracil phosphoribosyltransferase PyrR [Nesterenkonia alba]